MPPQYISQEALLEEIYDGEEKILQIQRNIIGMTDCLCSDIVSVADPDNQQGNNISADEKIHLIEIANKIYRLIFENGDFNIYNGRLAHNCRLIAALALLDNQADRALEYLEQSAGYAFAADAVSKEMTFTSPAVNRIVDVKNTESTEESSTALLNRLFYQDTVSNRIVLKIEHIKANHSGLLLKKLEQSRYDVIRDDDRFKSIVERLAHYT
jgi:hypothetical protein